RHRFRAGRRLRRTQPTAQARRPVRQRRRRQGTGRLGRGARGRRGGVAEDGQDPRRPDCRAGRCRSARACGARAVTVLLGAALLPAALAAWAVVAYNRLVRLRNQVATAWSDIDVQLQRRHDLVPQLVAAVKGYAAHEGAVLEAVTALRSRALGLQDPAELGQVEAELEQALGRLLLLREAYPDLKASENFARLQADLVDVE